VRIILDHLARPVLEDDGPRVCRRRQPFALSRYPNVYLKLTPRTFTESRKGKSEPGDILPPAGFNLRSTPARLLGLPTILHRMGSLPELLALGEKLASHTLSQEDQDWIFGKTAQALYPALAK